MSNCKKDIIIFFYLFNLIKDSVTIVISYNSFHHTSGKSLKIIIYVNSKFLQIILFLNIFSSLTNLIY